MYDAPKLHDLMASRFQGSWSSILQDYNIPKSNMLSWLGVRAGARPITSNPTNSGDAGETRNPKTQHIVTV